MYNLDPSGISLEHYPPGCHFILFFFDFALPGLIRVYLCNYLFLIL